MVDHKEKFFEDWQEAKNHFTEFPHNWIFRGQGNINWRLETSLERAAFQGWDNKREKGFIEEFKRGAQNYLNPQDIPQTLAEWLSLMQHHGAPTRFLDFTLSPYIASYFAFEEDISSESVIWAINANYFRKESSKLFFEHFPEKKENGRIKLEDIVPNLIDRNNLTCAFPLEPTRQNRRYLIQQSVFMCLGSTIDTFEESLDSFEKASNNVEKIVLKNDLRGKALYDLDQMNISRESLFLNLEGFAQSLTTYFDTLFSYMIPFDRMRNFKRD
ncbi:MAG: FRG domain-containing protein [Balneolaceae bacterium]|nr:FRG domain-containing protein [Balneolaceae bacterium]